MILDYNRHRIVDIQSKHIIVSNELISVHLFSNSAIGVDIWNNDNDVLHDCLSLFSSYRHSMWNVEDYYTLRLSIHNAA